MECNNFKRTTQLGQKYSTPTDSNSQKPRFHLVATSANWFFCPKTKGNKVPFGHESKFFVLKINKLSCAICFGHTEKFEKATSKYQSDKETKPQFFFFTLFDHAIFFGNKCLIN